jgi:hypothetical protein
MPPNLTTHHTQADPRKLGSVDVPAHLVPRSWGASPTSLLTRKVAVPLDAGSTHAFLSVTDSEDARRQVCVKPDVAA